jgi:phosphoribosyl-ATP pyrophosphohydrolase
MQAFYELEKTIADRQAAGATGKSYTAQLLTEGLSKIGRKIAEEASEVVEAAAESGEEGRLHTIREGADVIYHLWVLFAFKKITLSEVESELASRFTMSGLEEKASRKKPQM